MGPSFGFPETFRRVLEAGFDLFGTSGRRFWLLETSGTGFWLPGALLEGPGGWFWLLETSGTGFWLPGALLEGPGGSIWGQGGSWRRFGALGGWI